MKYRHFLQVKVPLPIVSEKADLSLVDWEGKGEEGEGGAKREEGGERGEGGKGRKRRRMIDAFSCELHSSCS